MLYQQPYICMGHKQRLQDYDGTYLIWSGLKDLKSLETSVNFEGVNSPKENLNYLLVEI